MATRKQKAKVGIFLLLNVVIIIVAVVLMRGYRGERVPYRIVFEESVLGVNPGGIVEFVGVTVGNVDSIRVNEEGKAEADILVDPKKVTLYKGVKSELVIYSLAAGTYAISLSGGKAENGLLEPGATIPAKKSTLGSFTDTLDSILTRVGEVAESLALGLEGMKEGELIDTVRDMRTAVNDTLGDAQVLLQNANVKIDEVAAEVKPAVEDFKRVAENVNTLTVETTAMVQSFRGKLEAFDLDRTQENFNSVLEEASDTLTTINTTVESLSDLKDVVAYRSTNVEQALQESLVQLREALQSLSELVHAVSENPSSLIRGPGRPKGN
jgi:ABC-type transporter Mla subunit MlaD